MIKYFLNGNECNPVNRDEIEYIFDFRERRVRELEVSVDTLKFVKEDFTAIQFWRATKGDFLGMPLSIQYAPGNVVNYMLDFTDPAMVITDRSIEVKIIRYKGSDNFYDNAAGLSFGSLTWYPGDFRYLDYAVIPENQISLFISLSLATFSLAQEVGRAIQQVQEGIADLVEATTPTAAGPVWGAILAAAIKLAARIAYALFIIVALIKVVTELLNLIFPTIRQFKVCTLKRLIEKGCEHLGVSLQSSALDELENVAVCPVPLRVKDPSLFIELFAPASLAYTNGYPSVRDSIKTLGQAIEAAETLMNGKSKLVGNVFYLEQELYFEQNAAVNIPVAFNIQESLNNARGVNASDQYKRIVAYYQTDGSDVNTFDDQAGTLYETSAEIVASTGVNYELIKGLLNINIPFARGTRKGSLTFLESAAEALAQAVDAFTGGDLSGLIASRVNVMQVSSQYFNMTKLVVLNGTRLATNQNALLSCSAIVNKYYFSKFITNNQKYIFDPMKLAATGPEVFELLNNNFVTLDGGDVAELLFIRWNDKTNVALIDYTVRKAAINEEMQVLNSGF